ncbi:MAG: hypothetical protein P8Z79_24685 [Sedimentisphaerales bacterium]
MCKKVIGLVFVTLLLAVPEVQAQQAAWDRAVYWDADYPSAWGGGGDATRDALEAAGYTVLDAAALKTWMDGHIADRALSVVVMAKDVVPDTVAEAMNTSCTFRQYLDAGGKVVWSSDWPIYYQGHADGSMDTWGSAGASNVLGFNASSGPNDNNETVVFTDEGIAWGLTQTWTSQRPTSPTITSNMTVLATVSSGSAAGWVKHFLDGDKYRGFVRIHDTSGQQDPCDIIRVAEYVVTKASCISPADGSDHPDTWATLNWSPGAFAVSHDVYFGESHDDVEAGTGDTFRVNQVDTNYLVGFAGYPYPDGLVPGTTYYWRIDEVNPGSTAKGDVWSFTIPPKTAYDPDPADGAEQVELDAALTWTPGFGAKLHTVYLGDDYDVVNNATGGMPLGVTSYSPSGLEDGKVYYWRVDEFDAIETHKGDVWFFSTPGAVGNPYPAYGATDVTFTPILTWTAADNAASHQVYFGTDEDTVRNADTSSPEYEGSQNLGAESYDPGRLDWNATFYWRVDEVDAQGNVAKGPVWVFTTGGYLLVEDFESYTDDDAAGQAIWQTWIDGFGIATNGAQVGYLLPPYAEQTIVHSGKQSMPLLYDNTAPVTNSEASLTLTSPRDWTAEGVGELSLWFRGAPGNAAEPLYVAIANSAGAPAVVAYDDPAAAKTSSWTQWVIPLQAFADKGINLTNVDKIAIGLGSDSGLAASGGTGTVYIDDIRLYQEGSALGK